MPDVLVRAVPDDVHKELRLRARSEGLSLQAYVARLLRQHTARPTMAQWLASLESMPPAGPGPAGADLVQAESDERSAWLARRDRG